MTNYTADEKLLRSAPSGCTTHHDACACREAHFREVEADNERLREQAELFRAAWRRVVECPTHSDEARALLGGEKGADDAKSRG